MKQFLVVGAGRFGGGIIKELSRHDCQIVVCDLNEKYLDDYDEYTSYSLVGDMKENEVLDEFNIPDFDTVFVAIGNDEYSAILITKKLKERGAKKVIAKASGKEAGEILEGVGADFVIYPEEEAGAKAARRELMAGVIEYFEITKEVSAIEMEVPEAFWGKTLAELNFSNNYNLTVSLLLRDGKPLLSQISSERMQEADQFLLIGPNQSISNFRKKFS
ncbi:potassium channel family protein [Peribacillus kribbensis]|uniref:potassium channel family protein n=1 Tax=Peribacillus kribbensis TaxID=356658 RepID=UPI000416F653|nr:TrkA family potassium uptake protein [Peribacillus kribbensis]